MQDSQRFGSKTARGGAIAPVTGDPGLRPRSPVERRGQGTGERPRILIVEDHEDLRRFFALALSSQGYVIDEAGTAVDGLDRLRQHQYDLVLSDYAMPGETGAWMVDRAAEAGWLRATPVIMVTAHPEPVSMRQVRVLTKPVDFDDLVRQVRSIVSTPSPAPAETGEEWIELVLYISANSPASRQARKSLERILEGFDRPRIRLAVCDLAANPAAGEDDRIVFTPTLVRRRPPPRVWVVGSLRDPGIVADVLRVGGGRTRP